jgi:hypothetical protein
VNEDEILPMVHDGGPGADGAGMAPEAGAALSEEAVMPITRARRAVALCVVLVLLCAALPAAATPEHSAHRPAQTPSLAQGLLTWLAGLWPGAPSGAADRVSPAPRRFQKAMEPGAQATPTPLAEGNDPTAHPQLGGDMDPDG